MKKVLSSLFSFILCAGLFAMPVFSSYLPDTSGEYVYYQDKTFERESYIGIIYYDDETFGIRYYSPKSESLYLAEKEIALLLTVDKNANHWEMTGEKILTNISPDPESGDAQIVNYLHDLLYEFSSRRGKCPAISPDNQADQSLYTDFPQFGGDVKILYDCIVPLFNIRSISSEKDGKIFDCVAIGQIKSTSDTTFTDFKGINPSAGDEKAAQAYKKAKALPVNYEKQSVMLDKNWTQQLENCWTLEEDSLISISAIPAFYDDYQKNSCFLIRKLLLSSQNSYTDFSSSEYFIKEDSIKIFSENLNTKTGRKIVNQKLLSKATDSNAMDYFSIATYENAYNKNRSYFEKIIKSYCCKQ